jgi:hypothetical protein
MNKEIWHSTPGLVLVGVILSLIIMVLGRLFGATYFAMASITVVFLILLTIYLVLHIFEAKILKKIRKSITKHED